MDEEENDCRPEIIEEEPDDGESHLPCSVPLMSSKEYLVLRYHVPSKLKKPEAYAHHLLFMFYPFRNEDDPNATHQGRTQRNYYSQGL